MGAQQNELRLGHAFTGVVTVIRAVHLNLHGISSPKGLEKEPNGLTLRVVGHSVSLTQDVVVGGLVMNGLNMILVIRVTIWSWTSAARVTAVQSALGPTAFPVA